MSLAMFALLITAFFPVIGIRFPWVAIHWIAGVVLLATILWHIVRAIFRQDPGAMWIGREDVREGLRAVGGFLRRSRVIAPKAAKYPLDHKLFHHAAAAVGLAAIVTGVLMMFRIDTPLLPSNPYMLSDGAWGAVYVLHGLSGVALIALVTIHVYFAIRPEKRWLTRSMVWGWIGREEYLLHHDPARWVLNGGSSGQISEGSVAEASREAEPVAGA
jgi:thiosulfate reductase cytochrome b subunit